MRVALLAAVGLLWPVLGATCLPLVDDTTHAPAPGTQLAVALVSPVQAKSVTSGQVVAIRWTAVVPDVVVVDRRVGSGARR